MSNATDNKSFGSGLTAINEVCKGIFILPQHGMQRLNIFTVKSSLQKLMGPKNLTSLTIKRTTISKTK